MDTDNKPAPAAPPAATGTLAEQEKKPKWLPFSELVLIIPAYFYICSFQFEKGACAYFHIPSDLIEVDLVTTLTFSVYLCSVIIAICAIPVLLAFFFYSFSNKNEKLLPYIRTNTWLLAFLIGEFLLSFEVPTGYVFWIAISMALLGTNFLVFSYLKGALWQRIISWKSQKTEDDLDSLLKTLLLKALDSMPDIFYLKAVLSKNLRPKVIASVVLLIAIVIISNRLGELSASNQTTFEVYSDHGNWVLLKKYGDDLILKTYDPKSGMLGDSLQVVKVSQFSPITFSEKSNISLRGEKSALSVILKIFSPFEP